MCAYVRASLQRPIKFASKVLCALIPSPIVYDMTSAPCEMPEQLICEVYDTIMVDMVVSSQLSSVNGPNNTCLDSAG